MPKTSLSDRIYRFGILDSTNDEAIRRARKGEPEGVVFVADAQSEGRGRHGRRWESPPGKNLYVSFLLRPLRPPVEVLEVTRMAAQGVVEVLEGGVSLPRGKFTIKWPNDVLLNGKKIAGILSEMGSQGDETKWVVCGIGINVNADPEDFSPEVRKIATSLKIALGREFDREEILERLIVVFHKRYEKFKNPRH